MINVIWAMDPDKAPELDGFTIHLYIACWYLIKGDLMRMIINFQNKAKVGGYTNSMFSALIPKETNPSSFTQFHPIYVCNASNKIISKLLSNNIKALLNKLISPNQVGFIKGH